MDWTLGIFGLLILAAFSSGQGISVGHVDPATPDPNVDIDNSNPYDKTVDFFEDFTVNASPASPLRVARAVGNGAVIIEDILPIGINVKISSDGVIEVHEEIDHDDVNKWCRNLDTATQTLCVVTISVKDGAGDVANVLLRVKDVNDNPPQLEDANSCNELEVEENKVDGSMCTFKASDPDRVVDKDKLVFILSGDVELEPGTTIFKVDPTSGALGANNADYEKRTLHKLTINVEDSDGTPSVSPFTFFVNIRDMPDVAPIWTKLNPVLTVSEDAILDFTIFQIEATDGDRGVDSALTYGIDDNDYFKCSSDGKIQVKADLDATKINELRASLSFTLNVLAEEVLDPKFTVTSAITIFVQDIDDKVVEIKTPPTHPSIRIDESFSGEIPDTRFTAIDNDPTLEYTTYTAEITGENGGPLDPELQAAIKLSPVGPYTRETSFSLSIIAGEIDFDGPDYWRTVRKFQVVLQQNTTTIVVQDFSIQVDDVNDEKPVWDFPPADTFFTAEILENTLPGTTLPVKLAAHDDDYSPNFHTLKYSFDSRTPDYLEIAELTGALTVIGDVDYEIFETETFRIKVSDGLAANDEFTNLVVNVLPLYDEQPSIRLSVSKAEIDEGDYTGTGAKELPVILSISDPDYPDINGFQFSDVATCVLSADRKETEEWFELEGCSKLKVVGNVDREQDMDNPYEQIELTITVTDPNTEVNADSDEAVLVLTIKDVNDNAPAFEDMAELNDLRVLEWDADIEETEQQRKVLDIYATDDDTKTEFCFSIVDDGKFAEWFEFQNGAQEDCNKRGNTALRRRDRDSGNVDRESDWFNGMADPILDLTISVIDGEPSHNVTLDLQIRVEDRNDEKPIWDDVTVGLVSFEMDENDGGDCPDPSELADLFTVYASDRDECSKYSKFGCITFVIDDKSVIGDRFSVGETISIGANQTGQVSAKPCGIDRDTLQVSADGTFGYDLTILAYDNYIEGREIQPGNSEPHTIRIIVKDLNDNDPQFIDPAPSVPPNINLFTFSEDIEDEVQNFKFEIQDIDLEENSTMVATILSIEYDRNPRDGQPDGEWDSDNMSDAPFVIGASDNKEYFNLDSSPDFDFLDQYGVFYVNIQLEDQSSAPRNTTAKYAVQVTDTNNNFPTIELPRWGNQTVFICQDGETGEGKRVKVRSVGGSSEELEAFLAKDDDDLTTPNGQTDCYISDSSSDAVREYLEIVSTQGTAGSSCVLQWLKDWKYDENGYKEFVVILEARDRDMNDPKTSDPLEITLKMRAGLPEEPYFVENSIPMSIKENQAGVVDSFPDAIDANGEEDIIYYYIVGDSEDVLDHFELENATSTTLKVKSGKELDRETQDAYKIIILATNQPDVLPGLVQPPYSKSYLTISLKVDDVNDVTPKFPTNLISAGISAARTQIEDILDTSFPIEAMDPDIDDVITYVIATDIVTQNDSLKPVIGDSGVKPFTLERNGTKGQLRINYKPQPAHVGFFSFNISATDLADHVSTVELRIYVVSDNNFVDFYFDNNATYVNERRSKISEILTKFYEYTCVIDDVQLTKDSSTGAELGYSTTVTTHFLNALQSAAISSEYIKEWPSSKPDKFIEMVNELKSEGLLYDVLETRDDNGLSSEQKTIYALVAVCAVLGVILLTVGTSCFFKNRGMTRKIRVMSASAGAESGVTTMGEKGALPNTGIYDENPIYSDEVDMKVPDLDARSTTSGDESLVAVEDQDDFNGYQDNNNPAFEDEFNTSGEEDNIYGSVRNPAYDDESHYQVPSEGTNYDYPASPPPPFESTQSHTQSGGTMRRNPLANMTIGSE